MPFPWLFKRKKSDNVRSQSDSRSVQIWVESVESSSRTSSRTSQNRGRGSGGSSTEERRARARRASVDRDQDASGTDELEGESVLSDSLTQRSTLNSTRRRRRRGRKEVKKPQSSHHDEILSGAAYCHVGYITINNGAGNEENCRNGERQAPGPSQPISGSPSSQPPPQQSQAPYTYSPFAGGIPHPSPFAYAQYGPSMEARMEMGRAAFEDYQRNVMEPIQKAFYKQLHADVPKRLAAAGIAPGTYPLPGMGY